MAYDLFVATEPMHLHVSLTRMDRPVAAKE